MKAELFNFKCWIDNANSEHLESTLSQLLISAEFNILGFVDHHFSPQGYTALWLLAESHLALHTYPEHSKSYIELTSCVLHKKESFQQALSSLFKCEEG